MFGISSIKNLFLHKKKISNERFVISNKTNLLRINGEADGYPEQAKYRKFVVVEDTEKKVTPTNITTYYDEKKRVIERYIYGGGKNPMIKKYQYLSDAPNRKVEGDEQTRLVQTLEFIDNKWNVKTEEEFYVYKINSHKTKNGKIPKKLHISKNEYEYSGDTTKIQASLTEYPETFGMEAKSKIKQLKADILVTNNTPTIVKTEAKKVTIPSQDEYLSFRLLLGEMKLFTLCQHFIDKKGLGKIGIKFELNSEKVAKNAAGHFSPNTGTIMVKKLYRHYHPVKISAHEAEHAYQYSLIGRIGKWSNDFELKCYKTLGTVKSLKEMSEGNKYAVARENYPKITDSEKLRENKAYWENYMEVKAREEEAKSTSKYNEGREKLLDEFKYIPAKATL